MRLHLWMDCMHLPAVSYSTESMGGSKREKASERGWENTRVHLHNGGSSAASSGHASAVCFRISKGRVRNYF